MIDMTEEEQPQALIGSLRMLSLMPRCLLTATKQASVTASFVLATPAWWGIGDGAPA